MRDTAHGFTQISKIIGDVVKEISRRQELRLRLEAEMRRPLSDEEFLAIADRTGLKI